MNIKMMTSLLVGIALSAITLYLAFRNVCPHGKRKIDPAPGEPLLRCCSVNHSKFDYDGNRLSGPAKEALTKYETTVSEGNLLITLQ